MKLNSSKIVIVGGGSGIGLGVARAALEQGAHVTLVGRSREKLLPAATTLNDVGVCDPGEPQERAGVATIVADVTREEDVVRLFEEVGSLDHLVVTAVVGAYSPIASLDLAAARRLIDSKLIAALLLAKHAHGHMQSGGSITFTSGIAKDRPMSGGAVVAAVNGSLQPLARALAMEMAPTRVNVVSPGWVDTPVWDAIAGDGKTARWEQMARRLPVGRIGTPADLAQAYVFLMENTFTTGTTVHVDGGHAFV